MSDQDTIKERIRKVLELAERGATDGERAAAKHHLETLLSKYGLELSDVVGEQIPTEEVKFVYTHAWEKRLLHQLVAFIIDDYPNPKVYTDRRYDGKKNHTVFYDLTKAQRVEIEYLWPKYQAEFQKKFDEFMSAFIAANKLGITPRGNKSSDSLIEDERERMRRMWDMAEAMGSANIGRMAKLLGDGENNDE